MGGGVTRPQATVAKASQGGGQGATILAATLLTKQGGRQGQLCYDQPTQKGQAVRRGTFAGRLFFPISPLCHWEQPSRTAAGCHVLSRSVLRTPQLPPSS
jgi:hypothetical protein